MSITIQAPAIKFCTESKKVMLKVMLVTRLNGGATMRKLEDHLVQCNGVQGSAVDQNCDKWTHLPRYYAGFLHALFRR